VLFNSPEFLFGFLPALLTALLLAQRFGLTHLSVPILTIASLIFYGWWNWSFVGLLVVSITGNFFFGTFLARQRRKLFLGIGVGLNLALLGWFKYAHFGAKILEYVSGAAVTVGDVVLPLAISFFTFQQIAYLVDIYRGQHAEPNPWRYTLFVTFFPHLIAGPIVHHAEMLPQFDGGKLKVTYETISIGLAIFALGLFKKTILADPVGGYADLVFGSAEHGTAISLLTAWTGTAAFALKIYFDFSGYSDMAIGLAKMVNVRMPINFDSPYKATSIIEFWHRWHITLSRFLRDYLYIPLGGNRKGKGWRYANVFIVMLLGGLWHGAAWTFVAWGALHGVYLVVNHLWRSVRRSLVVNNAALVWLGRLAAHAITLIAVLVAWSLFRAESWSSARVMLDGLFGLNGFYLPVGYKDLLGTVGQLLEAAGVRFATEPDPAAYPTFSNLVHVLALFAFTLVAPNTHELMGAYDPALETRKTTPTFAAKYLNWQPTVLAGGVAAILLLISFSTFFAATPNEFIYFQF